MPRRCVVDTNVAMTADGRNAAASAQCQAASATALQEVMRGGHLFVDADGLILDEYIAALNVKGQPSLGRAVLTWFINNQWHPQRVSRVAITSTPRGPTLFLELARPPDGVLYDPSDQKFLAVAAAHPDRPPILQALDSKWWGWQSALGAIGVTIDFLCPGEIVAKHVEKGL